MKTAKLTKAACGLAAVAVLLLNAVVFALPESTTPNSPFTLGTATAATVTDYNSPLIGDNGAFPSTTATIYNLFGANNFDSVENAGDILFPDPPANSDTPPPINYVNFTTPTPVSLIGLAIYLDSDDGTLDGPRSVGTITFYANGSQVLSTAPVNESIAVNNGLNVFIFANIVTADTFSATFSDNPNIPVQTNGDTGVGPRVYELDGIPAPEPACGGAVALCGVGLLSRRRRPPLRSSLRPAARSVQSCFCEPSCDSK